MKALTLWQPWASLVALGVKTIETRSWSTRYRGPLAIHAGMKVVDVDTVGDYWCCVDRHGCLIRHGGTGPVLADQPLGAVVATCTLVDVLPMIDGHESDETDPALVLLHYPLRDAYERTLLRRPVVSASCDVTDQLPYGDFQPGRFAWILDDIVAVGAPVDVRGHQGLWEWAA